MTTLAEIVHEKRGAYDRTTMLRCDRTGRIIRITTMPLSRSGRYLTNYAEGRVDPSNPHFHNIVYTYNATRVDLDMQAAFDHHDQLVEAARIKGACHV